MRVEWQANREWEGDRECGGGRMEVTRSVGVAGWR